MVEKLLAAGADMESKTQVSRRGDEGVERFPSLLANREGSRATIKPFSSCSFSFEIFWGPGRLSEGTHLDQSLVRDQTLAS